MIMITPPECQGQMVQVSYGDDHNGLFYRRIYDRSDGSETWEVTDAYSCGCPDECDCWQPWDCEPEGYDWEKCNPPKD